MSEKQKKIKDIEIIIDVDYSLSPYMSGTITEAQWKKRAEDMLKQIKRHVDYGKGAYIKTTYFEEEEK